MMKSKTFCLCAALFSAAIGAAGCHSAPQLDPGAMMAGTGGAMNELTAAERAQGWQLLFDGRTLGGWRGINLPTVPAGHWTVENGSIKKIATVHISQEQRAARAPQATVMPDGQPAEGGDLMTEATYANFMLSWDWKMTPAGNSGVKYNVSEELSATIAPKTAAKGFEYQVIDDDRHPDGKLPSHRTGALYDLITPAETKHVSPVGEWNHSVLVFNGNHGEHWLNGQKVVEYDLGSPSLNAALAASKYKTIPWFAERRTGHIILQDHGDEVFFRNIKIKTLP